MRPVLHIQADDTGEAAVASFVEVPLPGGGSLIVEASGELDDAVVRAGRVQQIADAASESFESALDRVRLAAAVVRDKVKDLEVAPNEVAVEFSIKLGTAAGVVVASASTEANLKVLLRWTKE
jgi:NTP-dependent ternary system trypsin peptidase co-occuring protein